MLKKVWILMVFIWGGVYVTKAQEVGIRLGSLPEGSMAVDAVFPTNKSNRLHANLAFGDGVSADLIWDFIYRPIKGESLNWYFGAGPYFHAIENKDYESSSCESKTEFNTGIASELGIEYRFVDFPLAMGIDYRPAIAIYEHTAFDWLGFGFNVRYVFN